MQHEAARSEVLSTEDLYASVEELRCDRSVERVEGVHEHLDVQLVHVVKEVACRMHVGVGCVCASARVCRACTVQRVCACAARVRRMCGARIPSSLRTSCSSMQRMWPAVTKALRQAGVG